MTDIYAALAFMDMLIAAALVTVTEQIITDARECFSEYRLIDKASGKERNHVVTIDFYIRLFIVGLVPLFNLLMLYSFIFDKATQIEDWIEIIEERFYLTGR